MRERMRCLALTLALSAVSGLPAGAVVDLCDTVASPGCLQDFATCEFDIDYGDTGQVRALGALRIDGVGTFVNPEITDPNSTLGLDLGCAVSGQGTALLEVTTSLTNSGGAATPALHLFSFVNPDGNAFSFSSFLFDAPSATWGVATAGDPAAWGIDSIENLDDDTPGNIDYEIFNPASSGLADSNYCGSFCDVVQALQFDLGSLAAGETATVTVSYSDDGTGLSARLLTTARTDDFGTPDDPNTVLTHSGIIEEDTDLDGILDDGDGSGIAGDDPCSCTAPGVPGGCETGCDDNCPFRFNPTQEDRGGVTSSQYVPGNGGPDLIGDDCQCGDMNGDGVVNATDLVLYRRKFTGQPSPFSTDRCSIVGSDGVCNTTDVTIIRRTLSGQTVGILADVCPAWLGLPDPMAP